MALVPDMWAWCTECASPVAMPSFTIILIIFFSKICTSDLGAGHVSLVHRMCQSSSNAKRNNYIDYFF